MNILAIDYGKRWVGLAIGNTEDKFSVPLETIDLEKEGGLFRILKEICSERDIKKIIIGTPITMQGGKGESAEVIDGFVEDLKKEINLPVELVDERLTSKMARKDLISSGDEHSRAAALLLESFLSCHPSHGGIPAPRIDVRGRLRPE